MFEANKIREAEFFYALLLDEEQKTNDNSDRFGWYLSAFLSATRSVLQYALKEAVGWGKTGGQVWYDSTMSKSRVLQYFKEKRDVNIHVQPIDAIKQIDISLYDTIWMGAAPPVPGHVGWPAKISDNYRFVDWSGSEGILTLCIAYLRELRTFVQDGQNRGFLSP
jgi:hypothetical protein